MHFHCVCLSTVAPHFTFPVLLLLLLYLPLIVLLLLLHPQM